MNLYATDRRCTDCGQAKPELNEDQATCNECLARNRPEPGGRPGRR